MSQVHLLQPNRVTSNPIAGRFHLQRSVYKTSLSCMMSTVLLGHLCVAATYSLQCLHPYRHIIAAEVPFGYPVSTKAADKCLLCTSAQLPLMISSLRLNNKVNKHGCQKQATWGLLAQACM